MGTVTTGNIKAGALEASDSPASNTYVSIANSTVTLYESTAYTTGGQEIETFDFTENGLSQGESFVYEKSGAGKLQGYPGLCLVSDQVNGSQIFVDRGPSKHKITAINDTHHDSGGGKYLHNDTAIYFDGTGDLLNVTNSPDFYLGMNDFTIDTWVWKTASPRQLFTHGNNNDTDYYRLDLNATDNPSFFIYQSGVTTTSVSATDSSLADDVWGHLAIVRSAGLVTMYINGEAKGTMWYPNNIQQFTADFQLGSRLTGSTQYEFMEGYIDDFRFTNGLARWTKNFNPPSRSPKDNRGYGDVADYTKITMMGYRSDSASYFTAINYVAGDEIVARDYMGIGYDDLKSVAYSGGTQQIVVHNHTTNTVKFTAYVETTT